MKKMKIENLELECKFCKKGNYEEYVNQENEKGCLVNDLGLRTIAQNEWTILICDNCGNIQFFREDLSNSI